MPPENEFSQPAAWCSYRPGDMSSWLKLFGLPTVFAALLSVGCQTTHTKLTPGMPLNTTVRVGGSHLPDGPVAQPPAQQQTADPERIKSDPSAARLHDICGSMLLYYASYRAMPRTLSDLQAVQDMDVQIDTTSPVSHQPYVYVPGGLVGVGHAKRIIIYDPVPLPNGKRWCVFASDSSAGQAQSLEVVLTPDSVFRAYVPAGS